MVQMTQTSSYTLSYGLMPQSLQSTLHSPELHRRCRRKHLHQMAFSQHVSSYKHELNARVFCIWSTFFQIYPALDVASGRCHFSSHLWFLWRLYCQILKAVSSLWGEVFQSVYLLFCQQLKLIRYKFVRERYQNGEIKVMHCSSENQAAIEVSERHFQLGNSVQVRW